MSTEASPRSSTDVDRLVTWAIKVLVHLGMEEADAAVVVDNLVWADLRGVYSHGMVRFPVYAERLVQRSTAAAGRPCVDTDTGGVAVVDGANAMGPVAGAFALDVAVDKAKEFGSGVVFVRRSNHYGACGWVVERAVRQGLVAISATVGGQNIMAPWGGVEPLLGNNPFAIGFPARRGPAVIFDMAMSVAARGKIMVAAKRHEPIPDDWALDTKGRPTTDPDLALAGTVRPLGDHKGYGLSLMVALLAGVLAQAATGRAVTSQDDHSREQNVGHYIHVIDVARLPGAADFRDRVDALVDLMHSAGAAAGAQILVPGEKEAVLQARQRTEGIDYPGGIVDELEHLGAQVGEPL